MFEDELDELIEEATLDAYGEYEQTLGFYTMLEDNLAMPFQTEMFGVEVLVEQVDINEDEQIFVLCSRGSNQQYISILDLPLPSPPPKGAEWIAAYGRWKRGE
jgi:hypothetical protein